MNVTKKLLLESFYTLLKYWIEKSPSHLERDLGRGFK